MADLCKKIAVYVRFFSEECDRSSLPTAASEQLDAVLESTNVQLGTFKSFYMSNKESKLRSFLGVLKRDAGGAEEGADWHSFVTAILSWSEFLNVTESNIRKADKIQLLQSIKATDVVRCISHPFPSHFLR